MGRSARAFLVCGRRPVQNQGPGYWVALSGAPSPDANMALVDSNDSAVLASALRQVEDSGFPTLFMLAGPGRRRELGTSWRYVGDMPFMARALAGTDQLADRRVRQARLDDFDVVSELVASSFGLTQEIGDVVAEILKLGDDAVKIWLLIDDERAVSTVLTSIVEDAVCVWCMGTPPRCARRGYGRALLADVLARARLEGASIGLLGATPAGRPLYDATGWTTLEGWQLFLSSDSTQFGH
jgi:GNAT superfamily N-acetyltransferase